jgi:hypothetical protein
VDSKQIIEKITNHVVQWNENHPAEAEEKKE